MSDKLEKATTSDNTRGGLVGPVLLIGVGIFFLLSNLGLITWDFWEAVGRLWPIVLIALGLDLLVGRRSLLGSALVVLVTVGLLGTGLLWLNQGGGRGEIVSGEISQSLAGATSAEMDIVFSVGRLQLEALAAESPLLVAGMLEYDERSREQVEQTFRKEGDVAHFELAARGTASGIPFGSQNQHNAWELMLNRDVPLDLQIRTGVGESDIDLSLLNLTNLSVSTGVGQTTIIMPGQGQVSGVINGGVGELLIRIPDGMAARIDVKTGLGASHIGGDFVRDGSVYTSPGYETAVDRLDLELRAGIGQVTVQPLTGR